MGLRPSISGTLFRCGVVVVAVVAAALLQWALVTTLGELPCFIAFYPVVTLVAMAAGGWAGAGATLLSALIADYWFVHPNHTLAIQSSAQGASLGLFTIAGLLISFMAELLHRARQREAAIAERRGAEQEREVATEFLGLINASSGTRQLVEAAVRFFREQSGCEAVGIRLKEGEDYPYYEAQGFPEEFVQLERSHCVRDPNGEIQRDQAGNSAMACMCGNVICGRFDPSKPFFTTAGSFWTNEARRLLARTAEADLQGHAPSRCNGMCYESVALIAVRVGDQRLGLLELNDRRRNRLTPERIALWERLAGYLAVALAKAQAEEAVRESEAKFSKAFAASPDAMVLSRADDGVIREVNESCVRLFGLERCEMIGRRSTDLGILDLADREGGIAILKKEGRLQDYELPIRRRSGEIRSTLCSVEPLEIAGEFLILSIIRDVTERKQAESDQELATELLRSLNRSEGDLRELIGQVLHLIRQRAGFDAVGLRLRKGEDCPYYQQDGFSEEFLREENYLCAKGADASILRDACSQPILECTCGLVLSGRADPTMSCFTQGGSFWTNRSAERLALAPEDDPRETPRNRCIYAGYQSVALVPVHCGEQIVGLLQLHDRQPDRFTPERIRFFEGLANNLGLALQRRQMEESLRLSEERFRTAFENGAIPMALTAASGELLKVNSAFCQMVGCSDAELVGRNFADFTHPDDLAENRAGIQRIAKGEASSFRMEKRYIRQDGSIIWVDMSTSFVHDAQGKPLHLVTHIQDVTDRKRREEDLCKLNRTLRALSSSDQAMLRAADESQYLQDVCSIIVKDCGHVMAWVGYALQDEGKTVEPVARAGLNQGYLQTAQITWADTEQGRGPTGTAIRTGTANICNNMLTDPRFGPWRQEALKRGYASSIALPLIADGKTFGALTIYSDKPAPFADEEVRLLTELAGELAYGITSIRMRQAHAQMTEALQAVSGELQRILDTAATGLTHYSRDLRYVSVNPAYAKWMGLPPEQIVGRPIVDVMGRAAFEVIRPYVERVLRGERVEYEAELPLAGGTKPVHAVYTPDRDHWGNVAGWVASVTDISQRRQAEQELLAAKSRAEEAQLVAESANRAKDQFIAILSHELRTPLTPALVAVSMMEADLRLPAEARENLAMVRRNIALEVHLIADLLDVSRVVSGKLHLEKQPMDVMVVIREAARIVSGDLDAKGQTLTIETAGPYLTFGDAARLQQVFWNLLRNAIKFTPHRGRIAVRASVVPVDHCPLAAKPCPVNMGDCPLPQASEENSEPCGGNLVIEVSDTGVGIAPEVLPRLFAPFEQGGEGRSLGGLGLGLSICKAVVEAHGGTIAVQSDGTGKGATFTVRLPIAQCPLAAASGTSSTCGDQTQARDDNGQAASPETPKAVRILLVEDHADTAKLMSRLLMAYGHEVTVADSIASALAVVEEAAGKLDLLISDLGLPDGSGHDLMRQLREEGKAIPAIALSGYGAAADIEKSKAAGFAEHVVKPTSPDLLAAAIQRVTSYHTFVNAGR